MPFSLTQNATAAQLLSSLIPPMGPDISYQNAILTGDPRCAALFSGAQFAVTDSFAQFPDSGIVLGTGDATSLYNQDGTETYTVFDTPGDADIAQGATEPSLDACTLQFEFQCNNIAGGNLAMNYVFASDEYKEQITEGLGYADVFGLLLNGANIATVPGSTDPVSVYTINHITETEYFVFNNPRPGQAAFPLFEPDGFTKGLKAEGSILPGWNTMKIGIVDINDAYLDSWVFLEGGSFLCIPDPQMTFSPTPSPTPSPVVDNTPGSCTGSACGDPHFRTFDDQFFSYHGQCDLVLSRSNGFASGLGLDVHIRTTRVNNPHMDYSYISGAAVKIGPDVLEVSEDGALIVNGDLVVLDDNVGTYFAGYALTKSVKGSKHRIIAHDLNLGNGNSIQIRANTKTGMLFVDMNGAFADSEGLLGAAPEEGKPLLARDGITDLTGHWNTYGEEWQVNAVDFKLFQDSTRHPQYPNSCEYNADVKNHVRRRLMDTDRVTLEVATDTCAHLKEDTMHEFCVNDIMATGDLDLVEDPFYAN